MTSTVEQLTPKIVDLCRRHSVRRLEVFGSAASGEEFDPHTSDVDFLVEFEPDADLGPWMAEYFALKAELEDVCQRPVDLVMASALKNPFFIREVNRTRQTVYAA